MEVFLQQLINGVAWGSIYALIALGYTMVYGVLKLINFAHGEVYMVGAMTGYYVARWLGVDANPSAGGLLIVLLAAMMVCAALGMLIERIAYRPLRRAPRLAPLITAIGVSLLLQNLGQIVFGADPKVAPGLLSSRVLVQAGSIAVTSLQVVIFAVSLSLCAGLTFAVHRTRMGKAMRAVSFDREAAALMGIPIDRVIAYTFALGSALAAAAGILVGLSNPKIDPLMGVMPGLKAFVAAVLGGIGSIPGAMLGGVLMGIAETMVSGYLSSTYRDAIAFVILIGVLVLRPEGLLGKPEREKV
ncbi:MAG: branched-chain amino acid ABC transporter permease [Bdellovibrionota bacterium]